MNQLECFNSHQADVREHLRGVPAAIRGSDTLFLKKRKTHKCSSLFDLKRVTSKNTLDRRELHPRRLVENGPIGLEMKDLKKKNC